MRLLIWILIRAAVFGVITLLAFDVGRGSVIYEICHLRDGDIKEISNDLVYFYNMYEEFHKGDSK